jgi:hypothetical protein
MQQGIGAAIQLSISEESSLASPSVGSTGGGISSTKDAGASNPPSGSFVGDALEKPSPEEQRKNRYNIVYCSNLLLVSRVLKYALTLCFIMSLVLECGNSC